MMSENHGAENHGVESHSDRCLMIMSVLKPGKPCISLLTYPQFQVLLSQFNEIK